MIEVAIAFTLLCIGYLFGSHREQKHFAELKLRESFLLNRVPARSDSGPKITNGTCFLVCGSVVIATDYFKNFVGNLKSFFGGRLSTHETLLDRARREAVTRMRESAFKKGAHEVVDVHIETSFIDQMGIEVSAYGTAITKTE